MRQCRHIWSNNFWSNILVWASWRQPPTSKCTTSNFQLQIWPLRLVKQVIWGVIWQLPGEVRQVRQDIDGRQDRPQRQDRQEKHYRHLNLTFQDTCVGQLSHLRCSSCFPKNTKFTILVYISGVLDSLWYDFQKIVHRQCCQVQNYPNLNYAKLDSIPPPQFGKSSAANTSQHSQ